MDDQVLLQGPFQFSDSSGSREFEGVMYHWGWDIIDAAGVRIASITGQLIDGSGGHEETDNMIRTAEQRRIEAQFVLDAMNAYWSQKYVRSIP